MVALSGNLCPATRIRRFEGPFFRMRDARQSAAASRSASVLKPEVDVCGHGGHVHRRYLIGPGGECRLFEVKFCEYAMRGSLPPHPALLVSSNTEWTDAATVDICILHILEAPGVNIAYWRKVPSCECVMRGSPPPHPARLTSQSIKYTPLSTVSVSKAGIFEAPA